MNVGGVITDKTGCFSHSLLRYWQEGLQWKTSSIVLHHCAHPPPIHPLLSLAASFRSQHDNYASALAAPLTSTLDQHHGEKTQKEINLAAQAFAVWTQFRSFGLEMLCPNRWPWTRVLAACGQTDGFRYFTNQNAPASCVGIYAFGAAGGFSPIGGDGANGRG